jgi:hypothetical protein
MLYMHTWLASIELRHWFTRSYCTPRAHQTSVDTLTAETLSLPVRVLGLKTASVLLVIHVMGTNSANVCLLTTKSDSTLLLASHAARVEQTSP